MHPAWQRRSSLKYNQVLGTPPSLPCGRLNGRKAALIPARTLTIDIIQERPTSGHLFLFRSRRGEAVKLLWWDRSGFVIWYKRLQKNTFRFPKATEGRLEIDARDLMMILEGLEYKDVTKRRDYRLSCEPGVL